MEITQEQVESLRGKRRPSSRHPLVIKFASVEITKKLVKEGFDEDGLLEQVEEMLDECYDLDGYEMVKYMEDVWCIEGSSSLVNTMDGSWIKLNRAEKAVVEAWIDVNNIKPKLSQGDEVKFKAHEYWFKAHEYWTKKEPIEKKWLTGEIVGINHEEAKYHIFCEEMGHVRSGPGTHATIKNFEEIERYQNELEGRS